MRVRAKFVCQSKTEHEHGGFALEFRACTQGDDDEQFWKWTPSGSLTMAVVQPETADRFKPGETYYLDFTPAPTEEA